MLSAAEDEMVMMVWMAKRVRINIILIEFDWFDDNGNFSIIGDKGEPGLAPPPGPPGLPGQPGELYSMQIRLVEIENENG